ncbi:MAG TPA: aminopeptidase P family protein [Pyrinomonadaceae bacterium]|nr:aminopeptidase P family protein [Pyrinomonadaceae bacterium]
MKLSYVVRALVAAALCIVVAAVADWPAGMGAREFVQADSPAIRVTPPAPVIDQHERLAELSQRRARVAEKIGKNAVLIMFSAEPRIYTHDVDYLYRQENNLYYLTNLKQKGATLVLMPGNSQLPEILFLPRRNPAAETWTGHMYAPGEAAMVSGIREIWAASEFEPFLRALRQRQPYRPKAGGVLLSATSEAQPASGPSGFEELIAAAGKNEASLYLLVPGEAESREYRQEQRFAADWSKSASGYSIRNATPIFADLRLRKSPMELRLLQHAVDITIEAMQRAWVAAENAKWEYEIDAQVAYTFKLRNADHWGYPPIVGCGPNATTLHYVESQGPVRPEDLLLMDIGAEYEHYTADITRTIPISGKFTPAQAELYQIVYDAQNSGARAIKPGAYTSDVHRAATEVIKEGLLKVGLITDKDSDQYRLWFMHGTVHWLGMNVHDVGSYGSRLEPGMVFTNEPGIYVRVDALDYLPYGWQQDRWEKFKAAVRPAFERYKGMGVRIEDDMLVTKDGVEWMSKALPRELSAVEEFLARSRANVRTAR